MTTEKPIPDQTGPQKASPDSKQPPEAKPAKQRFRHEGAERSDDDAFVESVGATRSPMPAWVFSVILHAAILLLIATTFDLGPKGLQADATTTIAGEIVLRQVDEALEDASETFLTQESPSALDQLVHDPSNNPFDAVPSVKIQQNPLNTELFGPTENTSVNDPSGGLQGLLSNPSQPRAAGHSTRTTFMSMGAEGTSFIYVIDRSASMGTGGSGSRLNYSIKQIQASLQHLDDNTRFQLLFYNHDIHPFRITGKSDQMVFATDQNKVLASRYLSSMSATGSTESAKALKAALDYGPDVIFFLSDSESNLSYIDLDAVKRKNNGGSVIINVIEFAPTPGDPARNNLRKLADQNGGAYLFVSTRSID